MVAMSLEELNVLREKEPDKHLLAVKLMHSHIYHRQIPFPELTDAEREAFQDFVPRYQAEHFPENYPEDDGYTGDYWTVFRGIHFLTKEDMDSFLRSLSDGILQTDRLSSWSLHPEVAEEFAAGSGYLSYAGEGAVAGYGGVVLTIPRLTKETLLFSGYEAHNAFSDYLNDEPDWNSRRQTFEREEEFVLLPGEIRVEVMKTVQNEVTPA